MRRACGVFVALNLIAVLATLAGAQQGGTGGAQKGAAAPKGTATARERPLVLTEAIPLENAKGRFEHFALGGGRLPTPRQDSDRHWRENGGVLREAGEGLRPLLSGGSGSRPPDRRSADLHGAGLKHAEAFDRLLWSCTRPGFDDLNCASEFPLERQCGRRRSLNLHAR